MSDIASLISRIDAEFAALDQKLKTFQSEQVHQHEARQGRLEKLSATFAQLSDVWTPRLQALAKKFGDKVKVTPKIEPSARQATFEFQSPVAQIRLTFNASTNQEVTHVILSRDLFILPILMQFQSHADLEMPLDAVDLKQAGQWIDDQIVSFVNTYLSLHQNEYYLKGHMVEDPVARIRFPKYAAATSLAADGKTYYFIGEETRREFEKQRGGASK
jgi:YHS domain-containing protein